MYAVISYIFWPREWDLMTPLKSLLGIGGATLCMQSQNPIIITGPEGKAIIICSFVVQKPIPLWGKDLVSQWSNLIYLGLS